MLEKDVAKMSADEARKYAKELQDEVKAKDALIADLRMENDQMEKSHDIEMKEMTNIINERTKELNDYIDAHGNMLKALQGTLDMSIKNNSNALARVQNYNKQVDDYFGRKRAAHEKALAEKQAKGQQKAVVEDAPVS